MIFIIAVTYTFNEHRIYLFIYERIVLAVCVYFIPVTEGSTDYLKRQTKIFYF